MQYLLKVSLNNTSAWRLVAIDGNADISHIAALISVAFDYKQANCTFIINNKTLDCGFGGEATSLDSMRTLDSFDLREGASFTFIHNLKEEFMHDVNIMKVCEKLSCFMPSCLVGSGLIAEGHDETLEAINTYIDSDEAQSLDLRLCTQRMRALGATRQNINKALNNVSMLNVALKSD